SGPGSDSNSNGIPDECEEIPFIRGDVNASQVVDIADVTSTLDFLFSASPPPDCIDSADANDDGLVDLADAISLLSYLFSGASAPPAPFPGCDIDPTMDALDCDSFAACP
ncbi:MAG: hypothetical protein AAEJ46_03800, partial [Planctomycetota bacterium]